MLLLKMMNIKQLYKVYVFEYQQDQKLLANDLRPLKNTPLFTEVK